MVSTPAAPDPYKTAEAQSKWNNTTAQTQQALNMVDQVNPWGTSSYNQTGTQTIIGADGNPIEVPRYQQTTTLSPEQQAIFEQGQVAQGNLAGLAADQSLRMREYLNEPFSFDNRDAETWAYDLASPRILAQQGQNEEALRTRLVNSGIREGSAAWNAEMARMTNANTDQLNQLALTGRGQAFQEALAARNQPINELSALMSGSQVGMPQFGATPQTGVAGVDYTGLVNNQYQAQLQQANSANNAIGGLFGLGMKMLPFSDRRLKTDVKRVGRTDAGVPIYTYRYVWGGPVHMGVMAQDVPEAAHMHESGYMMVDYGEVE